MNYKIFQICFEKDQIERVDPLFTPFDNTENLHPELREYQSFKRIYEEDRAKGLDAFGVFGPRWQEKLRFSAETITNAIDNNPGYHVYVFNHARVVDALTHNVWEHGEVFHKGIQRVTESALKAAGYDTKVLNEVMGSNVCYSSYFVAKKVFWRDYLDFLDDMKSRFEDLTGEDARIYRSSANYSRDKELTMFPFIVERLFSTFLHLNKEYKVYSNPYDYSVYQVPEFESLLETLNHLKRQSIETKNIDTYKRWHGLRERILTDHPRVFHLD